MAAMDDKSKAPEEKPDPATTDATDIENPPLCMSNNNCGKIVQGGPLGAPSKMPPVDSSAHSSDGDGESVNSVTRARRKSNFLIMCLIIFLGLATSCAFLAIGITAAKGDQQEQFERRAEDLVNRIERSWHDYVVAASYIHGRCRGRNFTRADFRQTFEYLNSSGLEFQAAQFDPNVTNDERPYYEEEARKYYAEHYSYINYTGFMGFNTVNLTKPEPRDPAPYYFPIHYMEPIPGNERAIDLDYHASGSRKKTVMISIDTGLPSLTDRLVLVQETGNTFGVVLFHPGYNLTEGTDVWPRDLASIVIRIPDLLRRAAAGNGISSAVYIYDESDSLGVPRFLGASEIVTGKNDANLPERELADLEKWLHHGGILHQANRIKAANKDWVVVTHALDGAYQPNLAFVIFGGIIIFLASVCLAYWVHANSKRIDAYNKMRAHAESERAALILENARQATKAERELNDFIAHEVGNLWWD